MNTMNKTIDLMPYLPVQPVKRNRRTLKNIATVLGVIIESAVTFGIGVCLLTGIYVFLSIV